MPLRTLLVPIVLAYPVTVFGQAWEHAYKAGDFQKAAALLHPVVIQAQIGNSDDPAPPRRLATMYAEGRGVVRDPISACALAQVAHAATMLAAPKYAQDVLGYQAAMKDGEEFVRQHCEPLTYDERVAASTSMGCFAFGMPEEVLMVGDRAVRIGRRGFRAEGAPDPGHAPNFGCAQLIARVRPLIVTPPFDQAPGVKPRHFIEMLSWALGGDPQTGPVAYVLQWHVFEVYGAGVGQVAFEQLHSVDSWPDPALPPRIDRAIEFEMIRSGHVRWRLDGRPPKRGWITLPEETK